MPNKIDDNVDNIFDQLNMVTNNLSHFKSEITSIQQQIKMIEKNVKRVIMKLKKDATSKHKGNKNPSGFAKPTKVTKELCEFMNKEEGSEIARTEVTRALISYIKTNNLQNKENNKVISPDDKLKFLLGINDNEELTYFNLQKYMNKHFLSSVKTQEEV